MNSEWRGAHQQEAQGLNAGLDYVFDHQVNSEWRGAHQQEAQGLG
jgi:hypothetical protein